jgi:hypothetical protein
MSEVAQNALALLRRELGRSKKRRKGCWTYKLHSLLGCLLLARLLRHAVWLNLIHEAAD